MQLKTFSYNSENKIKNLVFATSIKVSDYFSNHTGVALAHDEVWKVLADLIAEFRTYGETIPSEIMENLRSAKSLIQVSRADPSNPKDATQVEVYVESVESYLVSKAQERFDQTFVEQWMKKLKEARVKATEDVVSGSMSSKFLPNMPRDIRWIRVKISADIPRDAVDAIANEAGLLTRIQEDDYLLAYGEAEKVKLFVRKLTEKFRGARKS